MLLAQVTGKLTKQMSGTWMRAEPLSKRRSLRMVSSVLRMAELALNTSSMKATFALGRYPSICRMYLSSSRARMLRGPNNSCNETQSWHPGRLVGERILAAAVVMNQQRANLRDGEACQEALKELTIVQAGQATAQFALGSAWRPDEEDVLPRQCCQQQQTNLQEQVHRLYCTPRWTSATPMVLSR